jgi:hypothetical protein
MIEKFSLGRLAATSTAVAALIAALVSPASAMPFGGIGAASDIVTVQLKHGGGGHPGGGHPGGGHPGGGHMHMGGGGHWGGGGGGWHHGGGWGAAGVGAAIGFGILGAAAAAAAYGAPPQPGMCWYYDNPMHSSGHWDYCQ